MSLTAELGRPPSPQHRSSSPQAPTLQPNLTTSFLSPPPAEGSWGGCFSASTIKSQSSE